MTRPVAVATCARPAVHWGRYGAVVVRATWDYHQKAAAFRAWIDRVESSGAALWNPAKALRANMDKRYLRDLESAGV